MLRQGVIGRLWRGEERLAVAFWEFLILYNVLIVLAIHFAYPRLAMLLGFSLKSTVLSGLALLWTFLLTFHAFSILAVWKNAFNVGWRGWGFVARMLVILMGASLGIAFYRLVMTFPALTQMLSAI
jgi:hypothetical protein